MDFIKLEVFAEECVVPTNKEVTYLYFELTDTVKPA
jgi:hypothetical protein